MALSNKTQHKVYRLKHKWLKWNIKTFKNYNVVQTCKSIKREELCNGIQVKQLKPDIALYTT